MTRKERKVFLQLPNPLEWVIIQDLMFDVIVYNGDPFTELKKRIHRHRDKNIAMLQELCFLLFEVVCAGLEYIECRGEK